MNRSKTYSLSAKDIVKAWHVLDATDQTLGRLATSVAVLLMGKHKPTYSPHLDMGDFVIIVNAEKVRVTGKKLDDKIYYRHTGYMGGLKETTLSDMLARNPRRVIELSVRGMLPRNRLSRQLLGHLKVYAGPVHPHEAQVNASRKGKDSRGGPQPSVAGRRNGNARGRAVTSEVAGVSAKKKRGSAAAPRSIVGRGGETQRSRKPAAAKTGETKNKRTSARTSKESKA